MPSAELGTTNTDICIIGGGIYGCGIAQAAAASGYKTLLIEKGEVASGTSSQSTKLIHGGLRYLEHAHLGLVYEALHERETLLAVAPDLVRREWFYIPVYRRRRRPGWKIGCGLMLYYLLSGGRSHFRHLPKNRWGEVLPGLKQDELQSVWAYQDAATDDAALTRAVAKSAHSFGCNIREHVAFLSANAVNDVWTIKLSDQTTLHARVLINAAGAWINHIGHRIHPLPPQSDVQLVQGSHLLLDRDCPSYIYTESLDGRVMFFRPWRGRMLVGTTEAPYVGDPDEIRPTAAEIQSILDTHNYFFPARPCSAQDILETYCGLRVLPKKDGSAFTASRETQIIEQTHPASYLAVYGGKLTTYRRESEKALKIIARLLPGHQLAKTSRIPLSGR